MLKLILSISGKPGLFKLISQGRGNIIVESLVDKKKVPAYAHDKVISLNDISIYTLDGETPLKEIFTTIAKKENGAQASIDPKSDAKALRAYFAEILPDYDEERVYPTDIKKVITWYNILTANGITDFTAEETAEVA
ncbi:MAG: DUF5606 family protein, partial [Bacteroidales bacterium]